MSSYDALDKLGEGIVAVWSDGLECHSWGKLQRLKRPTGKIVLGLAGVFFRTADSLREFLDD